jgi:hypothetical protein
LLSDHAERVHLETVARFVILGGAAGRESEQARAVKGDVEFSIAERFHSNPLGSPVLSPPIMRNGSSPLPAMRTKWLAM